MGTKKSSFDTSLQNLGQYAKGTSSKTGKFLGNIASQSQKVGGEATAQIGQVISDKIQQSKTPKKQMLDLSQVDEKIRLPFYGALFAIATIDGHFDREEMEFIFSIMDLENMSEEAKGEVQSYIMKPPLFSKCLQKLSNADERLRYGLMINLVDLAWADDELHPHEEKAILLAKLEFKITDEQLEAIEEFIQKMRAIRDRGLDDNYATDAVKQAASGLSAVGVPLAAVWFSGSVIGFSAAGITSGLAALGALVGMGGMIPGIGVAILMGAGIYTGLNLFLDTGNKRKKAQLKAEAERKAQLVIKNMQDSMNLLVENIATLQEKAANLEQSAAEAEANREAIRMLTERLRFMKKSVNKRKTCFGS